MIWFSSKGQAWNFWHPLTVLPSSRVVSSNRVEGVSPLVGTKTVRRFHLDLYHTDILFCLIVVEWHLKIIHIRRYIIFVVFQSLYQVPRGAFGSSFALFKQLTVWFRGWVSLQALFNQSIIVPIIIIRLCSHSIPNVDRFGLVLIVSGSSG